VRESGSMYGEDGADEEFTQVENGDDGGEDRGV